MRSVYTKLSINAHILSYIMYIYIIYIDTVIHYIIIYILETFAVIDKKEGNVIQGSLEPLDVTHQVILYFIYV